MKIHALLALVVVLVISLVWWSVTGHRSAPAPISAAPVESKEHVASPSALSNGPLIDATTNAGRSDAVERAIPAVDELEKAAKQSSKADPIVLYGLLLSPAGKQELDDRTWIVVTDRLGERKSAEPSNDGAYSISGLAPGKYKVSAGSYNGGKSKATVDLAYEESPKRLDITLQETTVLTVIAADESGNSLKGRGFVPVATMTEPGEWIDERNGREKGPFGIGHFSWHGSGQPSSPGDPMGTFTFDFPLPVFVSIVHYQRVVAVKEVLPGQTEVTFVVELGAPQMLTGSLRARFVDGEGVEIPNVTVMLNGGGGRHLPNSSRLFVENLPPGWYEVRASARGFERGLLRFRIEPGIEKDLGNVVLQPEMWVSGRIVSPRALKEREGFECEPYDPAGDGTRWGNNIYSYSPRPDGSFRIPGLSRGLYLLRWMGSNAEADVGAWARVIDTRNGPVEDIVVELVLAVPLVLTPSIDDFESVRFRVFDTSGAPLISSRLWSDTPYPVRLAPGDYELEVRTGSGDPVRRPVWIGTEPVELAIP